MLLKSRRRKLVTKNLLAFEQTPVKSKEGSAQSEEANKNSSVTMQDPSFGNDVHETRDPCQDPSEDAQLGLEGLNATGRLE